MKSQTTTVCFLAGLLAVTISAPASGQTTSTTTTTSTTSKPKPRIVEITGDDKMKFDKTEITAKPGETLRIVLKSVGTAPKAIMGHNFVLLKAGVDPVEFNKAAFNARATDFIPVELKAQIIAATTLVGPGETAEVTVKVPTAPGRYTYLCSFPGHFALGMRGILIVK
jgi:azurin